jgi:hypothetical protein
MQFLILKFGFMNTLTHIRRIPKRPPSQIPLHGFIYNCTKYISNYVTLWTSILIGLMGDGVQLSPLGIAATNMPIGPTPGDYDDREIGGMTIGRGNRSTQRKPAPVPLCPP